MAREENKTIRLRNVRLSFEHIWKKSASVEGGTLKYRGNFLIDPKSADGKKNIGMIEDAIEDLYDSEWGGKKPKIKADRFPLLDGDDMTDAEGNVRDGYEGMMYVKANNDRKPKCKDRDGETDLEEADDKIYSGAIVNAYVRLYAIKDQKRGGNGIFASLEGVQFVKHGEKFGGGGMDDGEFEKMAPDEDDEDDRPRKRGRSIDDEDEERPRNSRSRDEDDTPRRRSRDDDDAPRRRNRDEDDEPRPKRRRLMDDDI